MTKAALLQLINNYITDNITGEITPTKLREVLSSITDSIPDVSFSAVQQGGGIGQGTSKVYLGWSTGLDANGNQRLKATINVTDIGNIVFDADLNSSLNSKQNTITGAATTITVSNLTASRAVVSDASGKVAAASTTAVEIGYLSGVTSALQTQLNSKQATLTGAATTIATANLTASRAVVSDASGKVAVSAATATEAGYLSGVTSAIQTQLNAKAASAHDHNTIYLALAGGTLTGDITIGKNNPWITLDSSNTGGDGTDQGAGISIGEAGYKAAAALHLTYTGEGMGHIGMGVVNATTNLPQYEVLRLNYLDNIARFMGNVTVAGNMSATGNVTSNSDAKLKDNVESLSGALDAVMKLDAKTYTRNDLNDRPEIGFIAQEVKGVLPSLVEYNQETEIHSLDYARLTAVLINAMKEQTAIIIGLQNQIDELRKCQ